MKIRCHALLKLCLATIAISPVRLCQAQCSGLKSKLCRQNTGCSWSGGTCSASGGETNPPGPTPPPSPAGGSFDGICLCGECSSGSNEGQSCSEDLDCGGVCNIGGDLCTNDNMCLPNSGKPSNRGFCVGMQGICQEIICPMWVASPGNSPTYKPGFYETNTLLYDKYGRAVSVSDGMNGKAVAYSGENVQLFDPNGNCIGSSSETFHSLPDGAESFEDGVGGFYYSSNSEASDGAGGVGVLHFDRNGNVIDYYMTLTGTTRNCGGGKTLWGTWVSCEEHGGGQVFQTDPSGIETARSTNVVDAGNNYEAFTYVHDASDPAFSTPTFYTTCDGSCPLVKFTPNATGMKCFNQLNNRDRWCTLDHGTYTFLKLNPYHSNPDEGTFEWVATRGEANPSERYPYAEGIDTRGKKIYFTTKTTKKLFILDLVTGTYIRSSTVGGAFQNQPDQIQSIVDDPNQIVYFCEDGGSDCGVHGRDAKGQFFSILDGTGYNTETTGIAFSPGGEYMLLSFQSPGVIWQFWRTDGLKFTDQILQIKYHAT